MKATESPYVLESRELPRAMPVDAWLTLRATALETATKRDGKAVQAGPFFYQNCEYGFGTMLSINYFTSLLRDGLWSEGWFGAEGMLRWGYFSQIFTYNDRQLQWSAITNGYLANRQAHLLGCNHRLRVEQRLDQARFGHGRFFHQVQHDALHGLLAKRRHHQAAGHDLAG